MKEFKSISGLINGELGHFDDTPADDRIQQNLREFWRQQVGDVSLHATPLLFESGRLVIFCHSPIWTTQLRHQQPSLHKQLEAEGFHVTEIKIRVSPIDKPAPPKSVKSASMPESARNQLKSMSDNISHSGLKDALLRLSEIRGRKKNRLGSSGGGDK